MDVLSGFIPILTNLRITTVSWKRVMEFITRLKKFQNKGAMTEEETRPLLGSQRIIARSDRKHQWRRNSKIKYKPSNHRWFYVDSPGLIEFFQMEWYKLLKFKGVSQFSYTCKVNSTNNCVLMIQCCLNWFCMYLKYTECA